jgi:hypothetical protein
VANDQDGWRRVACMYGISGTRPHVNFRIQMGLMDATLICETCHITAARHKGLQHAARVGVTQLDVDIT